MHVGLVKVKYMQSRIDSNASFADVVFRLLCTTDHLVTAINISYLSAVYCRQESQAVGHLQ